jgi:hypothetical protein
VFFLLFKRNNNEKTLKVVFYYILYCAVNEFTGLYLHEIGIEITPILFGIFTVVEFTFFSLFYYYALPTILIKKTVPKIWGIFLVFACVDFVLIDKMDTYGSFAVGVEYICIILMCIYYLLAQLKGVNNLSVYSTSNFWVIITFLIYTSGTFFLYIMADKMLSNRTFRIQYIFINSSFNILKNVLLALAMLMKHTPTNIQKQKNKSWDDDFHEFKLKNQA